MALEALRGRRAIVELAAEQGVSRKFIYQQKDRAQAALQQAFEPDSLPEGFLGWLPVTRSWVQRLIVSAALSCHGSVRGICDHVEAIAGRSVSEGTVHNVLQNAIGKADKINQSQNLSSIRAGAHDEIFSQRVPVLGGVEPVSSYVYLLEASDSRDEVAWWVALTDKHERQGLNLDISISDAARGLLAGVKQAFPNLDLRGDVLHAQMEVSKMLRYLENRAYASLDYLQRQERKMDRAKKKHRGNRHSKTVTLARPAAARSVDLYDDLALLSRWWTELLGLIGPDLQERRDLWDWILGEMEIRAAAAPHRIGPVVTYLKNHRDALLAFVGPLRQELAQIAQSLQVPASLVEATYHQLGLDPDNPRFEEIERRLGQEAPEKAPAIEEAVFGLLEGTLRASSAVENLNSILRTYFFLRRSAGPEFLKLLQFYLNHRRFRRSERPERVGKSPRELLTGQPYPHWLEMLGYPAVQLLN